MKIVFTVASYYPLQDGVQTVTQYQAEGLASKGHDVTVITGYKGNMNKYDTHNNVNIIRIDAVNKYVFHLGEKHMFREAVIDSTKDADIMINVCLQSFASDWILGILDDISCPKFLYMHGMADFKWRKTDMINLKSIIKKTVSNMWWKSFYRIQKKNINKYELISHLHEYDHAFQYFTKNKISNNIILYNAAGENFFEKDTFNKVKNKKYFISVANYNERKNQLMCLEAFYESNTKNYGLVLIGSKKNSYYSKLIKVNQILQDKYGEKNVEILTDIPREIVSEYVKNASGFILTSFWEAFPISIIESMAAGVPFISTDVGIVKMLPGGAIVGNKQELKIWIESYINNPEIARLTGEVGNFFAIKHLNIATQNNLLEKLLIKITNDGVRMSNDTIK